MEAVMSGTDVVPELFGVVGRFRRQLRRSAGRGLDSARLSEAQSELLQNLTLLQRNLDLHGKA